MFLPVQGFDWFLKGRGRLLIETVCRSKGFIDPGTESSRSDIIMIIIIANVLLNEKVLEVGENEAAEKSLCLKAQRS